MSLLPIDIIQHIFAFSGEYRLHRGKDIVRVLAKNDPRYLLRRPMIMQHVLGAEAILHQTKEKIVIYSFVNLPSQYLCYRLSIFKNDNYEMWSMIPVTEWVFRY